MAVAPIPVRGAALIPAAALTPAVVVRTPVVAALVRAVVVQTLVVAVPALTPSHALQVA
ncbi:hypothetical protein [Stenotrophomonas maltophilia]|uniref:hypothetical protein n=1 Tax=Stenotrophomonas maltophilia TaxID=40324 RepID=UPI00130430A2|nr:hypothetical protein [Stenotrophomonas maltophilia]